MKRLVLIFGLLFMATYPLFASLDPIGSYTNFKIKKELWVCTSIAFPVDISYDAFNIDFKNLVTGGYGYFIQVKPGQHPNGSGLPTAAATIQNPSKGVLNVIGKPAGVYEYIFVCTTDDFCGMNKGDQAVVRVYLVPQLTGFPVLTNICPGESETVDFNDFIPAEIRYFIEEMGWTLSYKRVGATADSVMPVTADLAVVGNTEYKFTINDASGQYPGAYTDTLQKSIYACPQDSALLTHTVRIREGEEYIIPDRKIAFCTDVLRIVPETWPVMNTNLFSYLGTKVDGGRWTIHSTGNYTFPPSDFPLDASSGQVGIPVGLIVDAFHIDSIVFKYSYKDCDGNDAETFLTFIFDKTKFTATFTEDETDVCRNLVSGVVDLASTFGFTVPLTSGTWYEKIGDEFQEMLYGAVNITDLNSGSLYTFRYDVSSAVDSLCLVEGEQALFHLRIHDAEIAPNAAVQICKNQFEAGVDVNLFKYVPGLNDPDRIDPTKVKWYDLSKEVDPLVPTNPIGDPTKYTLKATEEWQTHDTTNYMIPFKYEVESDCGPFSGNLYVSAVDSVKHDAQKTIKICYTDDYAKHVDLFQVLGVVGATGRFILIETTPPGKNLSGNFNEATGILNANGVFDENNSEEIYTFGYVPNGDSCVSGDVRVTIVVTKNVK
jgi:hypothetical protein